MGLGRRDAGVVLVTTARRSHAADIQLRQRRYLLIQLVRLVCFILAVLLPLPLSLRLVLVCAATLLPLAGVVAANAPTRGRRRTPVGVTSTAPPPAALPASRILDAE